MSVVPSTEGASGIDLGKLLNKTGMVPVDKSKIEEARPAVAAFAHGLRV